MITQRNSRTSSKSLIISNLSRLIREYHLAQKSHIQFQYVQPIRESGIKELLELYDNQENRNEIALLLKIKHEFDEKIFTDLEYALLIDGVVHVKSMLYKFIYEPYEPLETMTFTQRVNKLHEFVEQHKQFLMTPSDLKELELLRNYVPYPNKDHLLALLEISHQFTTTGLRLYTERPSLQQIRTFIHLYNTDTEEYRCELNNKEAVILKEIFDYHTPFL